MQIYRGKSVFAGIAEGKIKVISGREDKAVREKVSDTDAELERYDAAKEEALAQLSQLRDKAYKELGEAYAAIFEVHQMMLKDADFTDAIINIIKNDRANAEYAIGITADNFANMFSAMADEYMRGRSADVKDISARLIRILQGSGETENVTKEPVIVLARELTPSETLKLDRNKILSFVTAEGSVHSHTAILAKTMNIPALVRTELAITEDLDGKNAIVDGYDGVIYIEPDERTTKKLLERKKAEEERETLLLALKGKEDITLDGHSIRLYANIGSVADLDAVLENDAGGIGLFRSEFLYLERNDYPTEQEQIQIYRAVAEKMAGKPVIIRTLDIGADKKADYFQLEKEENPALGYRAIRICLDRPEIFKTQLRAILRAGVYGNIAVMYPMITSVEEVRKIKLLMEEAKLELEEQKITYADVSEGIMIETPAAVMLSRELAAEADFFSIGTNDLTQYTLAADRQNPKMDDFYRSIHPAVLKMIQMTVENAHKEGIWVGICGELGADTELTEQFIRMGVDEFSVSPGKILPIRKRVREISVKQTVEKCIQVTSP